MSIKKILLFSSLLTMNKDLNGTNLNKTSQNQNISLGIREDISFLDTIKLFLINDKYCQSVNLLSKENQKSMICVRKVPLRWKHTSKRKAKKN